MNTMSAKMEDNSVGIVHAKSEKQAEPVDLASLVTVMHRVVQDHQAEIKQLKQRLAVLEGK